MGSQLPLRRFNWPIARLRWIAMKLTVRIIRRKIIIISCLRVMLSVRGTKIIKIKKLILCWEIQISPSPQFLKMIVKNCILGNYKMGRKISMNNYWNFKTIIARRQVRTERRIRCMWTLLLVTFNIWKKCISILGRKICNKILWLKMFKSITAIV